MSRLVLLLPFGLLFWTDLALSFDLGSMGGPPSQQKTTLRYSGLLQPDQNSGLLQTLVDANVPVYRGEKTAVALSAHYEGMDLNPEKGKAADLYDIRFGASVSRQIEERRMWSVTTSFGSASDKPFEDATVSTLNVTGMYSSPGSEKGTWLFLLNYSNNRPILNNIPIPGFAYTYAPSPRFRGTFGVPFASIYWQFVEKWNLTFFTVAPWIAKAQLGYSVIGPIQVFSGFDFSQRTYLEYGRTRSKERLYFGEQSVFVGAKSPLSRIFYLELKGGRSFARRIYSAESYTPNPVNPTELGPSWFGGVTLSARL